MNTMFKDVLDIISKVVNAGGAVLIFYNGLRALSAWRNHQGNEISDNLLGMAAGAGVMGLAAFLARITV